MSRSYFSEKAIKNKTRFSKKDVKNDKIEESGAASESWDCYDGGTKPGDSPVEKTPSLGPAKPQVSYKIRICESA